MQCELRPDKKTQHFRSPGKRILESGTNKNKTHEVERILVYRGNKRVLCGCSIVRKGENCTSSKEAGTKLPDLVDQSMEFAFY